MSDSSQFTRSTTASQPLGGGCLSGFLLPPLAVFCIGAILAIVALGPFNSQASAESPRLAAGPAGTGGSSLIAGIFTPEVQYWSANIVRWAEAAGVDPDLVATVMQIESCGNPQATSRAGAMGLFQVMPYHFMQNEDAYNPDTNALRGLDYLRRSMEASDNDPRLALAGYNGGIGVIGRPAVDWAEETQHYATWGSGIYADAIRGATKSPHLQEWLEAGGASLCTQAHQRLGLIP